MPSMSQEGPLVLLLAHPVNDRGLTMRHPVDHFSWLRCSVLDAAASLSDISICQWAGELREGAAVA
jgi:hypothetical protein